jgi:hypothetical protein
MAVVSCAARPHMCGGAAECGAGSACAAGRCLPDGGTPAIDTARRLLFDPVDVAYLRRGEGRGDERGGAVPSIFVLGREADGDARLLLRFAVPLPKDARVLEAYVLLEPTDAVDADPIAIGIHAARIAEPWDPRALSWGRQPRVDDVRAPTTQVTGTAGLRPFVRVDVRDLVLRWRARDPSDQGIALVAENQSPTGVAFTLVGTTHERGGEEPSRARVTAGPRLELYLK